MSESWDAAVVLERGAESIRRAPQQQQCTGDPTVVLGEQQHCQAVQRGSWTVEEWAGQLVQLLETGWLQKPSPHHAAELQHFWTHLQVMEARQFDLQKK